MSPASDIILGLDVGTTAAKASLFSLDGDVRLTVSREYPLLNPQPGWHIQDPDAIARGVLEAMREAVARIDAGRVIGISISTAMHGLIGLDASLRPVTELLTWADSRAWAQAEILNEHSTGPRLHYTSGTPTHPMSPLVKLRWFRDTHPDLLAGTAHWIGLKDWILVVLTGQVATELSTASGSGMLDMEARTWNPEAIELTGIRPDQLPPIRNTTDILPLAPATAATLGLPAGLPVVLGAGDGPLGNLGTGAMEPGKAGLSIGTSGAVRMVVRTPAVVSGLFCYALTSDVWVAGGAVSNGGMVQRWLTETYAPGADDAEACRRGAMIPPGSDGLLMIPYLVAERASLWDSEIRGAFLHVRQAHTPDHFLRAGVEGVAYQLWTILRRLRMINRVEEVRATGGVFRSQLWRDVVAGVLNRPLIVTGAAEGSGLGAAILGAQALGVVDTLQDGYDLLRGDSSETRIVVSDAAREVYETMHYEVPRILQRYGRLGADFR
ncbi:gluconate kinase, FGGY family [Raineyella antarctica]|uniref:Gluconate kinase, FGGY family n=1 Tax=Raineyella antarctica TaxID=1577474 RepID=A0A1G6GN86_9ACTN|nr:gluconokinase [Raineyella antarctica]SDB83452.1 gluconate kinase, FGGY family [Raineyella antarctica]